MELEHFTAPSTIPVEATYEGPHIDLPITKDHFEALIYAFQRGEVRKIFIDYIKINNSIVIIDELKESIIIARALNYDCLFSFML